jgi:hypothetical protein
MEEFLSIHRFRSGMVDGLGMLQFLYASYVVLPSLDLTR